MRFQESPLSGVWTIELDPLSDERGSFARTFDVEEFSARGLDMEVVQCNASFTSRRDTLRGMHYQAEPFGEPKLVRCVRGVAFHVAVDLRPESLTYSRWYGVELSAESLRALYLPAGVAHGFQTLADDCEAFYQMGCRYMPEAARGVRWDDPAFGIRWPPVSDGGTRILSPRDMSFPDWEMSERE
ncbi:MAG TPA: dTDP-4-dehydrorhamnose 3,5-epimerase family protein [Solirubrobacteraceae bacterium]|nr:dTDP-4-dehydrorhamnose 3,5-epimerase family protein [Solirubrobacteraceae bacterium]